MGEDGEPDVDHKIKKQSPKCKTEYRERKGAMSR